MPFLLSTLLVTLLITFSAQLVDGQPYPCNPTQNTTGACSPNPGYPHSSYFIDFRTVDKLPPEFVLANYETISFGPLGAEFTFAKKGDAPQIWTDFMMLGCRYEITMQIASGVGMLSTAVLMSDDYDELDIEMSGNSFNFTNTQGVGSNNYFAKGRTGNWDRSEWFDVSHPETSFHTYYVDWNQNRTIWGVDGTDVRKLLAANCDNNMHQYPQSPMKLQIGLWDGGAADVNWGTVQWAGGYTDLSKVPYTMYVQSVKITNYKPAWGYNWTDTSGSWDSIELIQNPAILGISTTSSQSSPTTTSSQSPSTTTSSSTTTSTYSAATLSSSLAAAVSTSISAQHTTTPTTTISTSSVSSTLTSTTPAHSPTASSITISTTMSLNSSSTSSLCEEEMISSAYHVLTSVAGTSRVSNVQAASSILSPLSANPAVVSVAYAILSSQQASKTTVAAATLPLLSTAIVLHPASIPAVSSAYVIVSSRQASKTTVAAVTRPFTSITIASSSTTISAVSSSSGPRTAIVPSSTSVPSVPSSATSRSTSPTATAGATTNILAAGTPFSLSTPTPAPTTIPLSIMDSTSSVAVNAYSAPESSSSSSFVASIATSPVSIPSAPTDKSTAHITSTSTVTSHLTVYVHSTASSAVLTSISTADVSSYTLVYSSAVPIMSWNATALSSNMTSSATSEYSNSTATADHTPALATPSSSVATSVRSRGVMRMYAHLVRCWNLVWA